jgi:NAD(P)H-dependent FMN reductase
MNVPCSLENRPIARPVTDINVLVISGSKADPVNQTLSQVATDMSARRISVNVFDSLGDLPRYDDTLEMSGAPDQVVALRSAAGEAHAALVVTHHHNRVPLVVHNAIDWLTRGCQSALSDKPLAVIGRAAGCYSGVWSHHQTDHHRRSASAHIVECITVASLEEAVRKLVDQVRAVDALLAMEDASNQLPQGD